MSTDAKTEETPAELGPLTVLLVEDEPSVARVTALWLKKMGCNVIGATDGREADKLASERSVPIDLLLADVMLPGMRGPVLAGAIRRRHPETAVLFTSGYSPELVSELFAEHVDTAMLLRKPYTAAQLRASVKLALSRKAAAGAAAKEAAQPAAETNSTSSEPALRR
jgi:DNA-binding response OmpR family regulator